MSEISDFMKWFDAATERALKQGVLLRGKAQDVRKAPHKRFVRAEQSKAQRIEELLKAYFETEDIVTMVGCSPTTVTLVRARLRGKAWAQKKHAPAKRVGPRHSKILAQ